MATIKGKWKWNNIVNCADVNILDFPLPVQFVSNEKQFSQIRVNGFTAEIDFVYELYYVDENQTEVFVGYSDEGISFLSVTEKYRIMDFGKAEQEIDDKLFEFIVNNASQLVVELEFLGDITIKKDLHIEGSAYVGDKKILVEGDAVNVVIPEEVQVTTLTIGETTINEELLKKILASANIESLTNEYGEVQF